MRLFLIPFLYTSFITAQCLASPVDDISVWRERASKTKTGMLLADVKLLFPPYVPVESLHWFMWDPTTSTWKASAHDYYSYEGGTFTSGDHSISSYWVSPNVAVEIDYQATTSGDLLNRPVTAESAYPALITIFNPVPNAFSTAPFTLRNTAPRGSEWKQVGPRAFVTPFDLPSSLPQGTDPASVDL